MSALPVSQEALLLVKLEFMNQVSYTRFSEFISTCSFSENERIDLIKYGKKERWDQEHASYGDAFRRMFEDRMAKEITKTTLLGIRSGRADLIKLAGKAVAETNVLLTEACKRVPFRIDENGNRIVIDSMNRSDNYYLGKLEILKKAVTIGDKSQRMWAGAVGLQDALKTNFPEEEVGALNNVMEAMLGDLKDLVIGEAPEKPGNGKAAH